MPNNVTQSSHKFTFLLFPYSFGFSDTPRLQRFLDSALPKVVIETHIPRRQANSKFLFWMSNWLNTDGQFVASICFLGDNVHDADNLIALTIFQCFLLLSTS